MRTKRDFVEEQGEYEKDYPKWCDEDCIIKDRNTAKAIQKAVKAERLRTEKEIDRRIALQEQLGDFEHKEYAGKVLRELKKRLEEKEPEKEAIKDG